MKMRNLKFAIALLLLVGLGAYGSNASAQTTPVSACQTITVSGSYVLTKNLSATGNCLVIAVNNVTINLNGFTISGAKTGVAIGDLGLPHSAIVVEHGILTGFQKGIGLTASNVVEITDIRAVTMVGDGIDSGNRTVVSNSQSIDNGGNGISVGNDCEVMSSTANGNRYVGIVVGDDSAVTGDTASNNNGAGIQTGVQARVTGNTADNNGGHGIETAARSLSQQIRPAATRATVSRLVWPAQ